MSQKNQQEKPTQTGQVDYKQIVQKLNEFVNTPTPTNPTDYKNVCQSLLNETEITLIFGSLIVDPNSFQIISKAILKIFGSSIGSELLRNENVLKWLIGGLQQSSNTEYEQLNILSINVLYYALQTDKDIEFCIVHNKSTLFLWCLSLISSPFETSFQKLEKIIIKHSSNKLLLKTLFSQNIIEMLLNIKGQNKNNNINQIDKGTMQFRAHALWIAALTQYYKNKNAKNTDNNNDIEMKQNDEKKQDNNDNNVLQMYINGGLFTDLLKLLQCDDVLIQINVLPLLAQLSNFENGLILLLNQNIVSILTDLLKCDEAILFGKEIYKVLEKMIRNTKKIYNNGNNNDIIKWFDNKTLFEMIKLGFNSDDMSVKESCCLFLGLFCSFIKILKTFVIMKESNNNTAVNKLCEFINILEINPSVENKALAAAAVHGLCEIFGVISDINNEKDIYEFQYELLNELGAMNKLFILLKSPDDEMRFGVFRLVNNICKQEWGVGLINNTAGMFEYLTDRNDPDIMLGFQWKYTVLESIFKNRNMNNVFDQTHKDQLKKYIEQGVVFKSNNEKNKNNKKGDNVVQLGWEQY
eukprot:128729_1